MHQLLGNVLGGDIATIETNYAAASSNTNRLNPDFAFTPVRDAILDALSEIVVAISETPGHTDRQLVEEIFSGLATGATIPNTSGTGAFRLGVVGRVEDSSTGVTCNPTTLDKIRDYRLYSSTIYAGVDIYWYAIIDGLKIIHTRSAVYLYWPTFTRPTYNPASTYYLSDTYVPLTVAGAVAKMAPKEGQYMRLFEAMNGFYQKGLDLIRNYKTPEMYLPGMAIRAVQ